MPNPAKAALAASVLALLVCGPALARPDTRSMTCEQVRSLIQTNGPVVLTTGANTFDRYVRNYRSDCSWPDVPMTSYVQTKDGRCALLRCQEPTFLFPDRN